jgi:hypothetical protein
LNTYPSGHPGQRTIEQSTAVAGVGAKSDTAPTADMASTMAISVILFFME